MWGSLTPVSTEDGTRLSSYLFCRVSLALSTLLRRVGFVARTGRDDRDGICCNVRLDNDERKKETHLRIKGDGRNVVSVLCVLVLSPPLQLYMLRNLSHTPRPLDANLGAKAERCEAVFGVREHDTNVPPFDSLARR